MDTERIHQIESELQTLSRKRKELLDELKALRGAPVPEKTYGQPAAINSVNTPEDKIDVFLGLFRCREDVYPRFWENQKTGKKGFSPVCSNEWVPGICDKPKIKCSDCRHQAFLAFDHTIAKNHLQGREVIGTYAIRANNTCIFLAADFDKDSWKEDIIAYGDAARAIGVEVAL